MNDVIGPEFSIIVAVMNGADLIQQTVESVLSQDAVSFEIIVIDGGSTDGTVKYVESIANKIAHFRSEKDAGIADAWNKGLKVCRGKYIALLSVGDTFESSTLRDVSSCFNQTEADVVVGNVILHDEVGRQLTIVKPKLWGPFWKGIGFLHPGMFVRAGVYSSHIGSFSEKYRIAMDCDFILRCFRAGTKFVVCDATVHMLAGGVSSRQKYIAMGEYAHVLAANGFSDSYAAIYLVRSGCLLIFRGIAKWIRARFAGNGSS